MRRIFDEQHSVKLSLCRSRPADASYHSRAFKGKICFTLRWSISLFFFHENPLVHLMIQTISFVTLNNFRKVKPHDDKLGLITIHQIIYPSLLIMPIWSWRDFSKAPLRFHYAQLSLFTQLMHGTINSGKMESGCMPVFSLCQSL